MRGINKAILIGNIGKDPEVKHLSNGNMMVLASLATSESYKDKENNTVQKTEWHNLVFFGKIAEIAGMYLKKGMKAYIEGKIKTLSWDDKNGEKKYRTNIEVSQMEILSEKEKEKKQQELPVEEFNDDEIPF